MKRLIFVVLFTEATASVASMETTALMILLKDYGPLLEH
jgi:hypothetical protein